MQDRLKPVNALVGLCTPGDLNPAALHNAGFRLVGLEVPVLVDGLGRVVIDVLLLHAASSHLVACESKSGANVDEDQARKYAALDARTVVLAGAVDLPKRTPPTVETLYLCLARNAGRVRQGLSAAGAAFPVLVVAPAAVDLLGREQASPLLASALADAPLPLPTGIGRHIAFDDHSTADDLRPAVRAQLSALQSNRTGAAEVSVIAGLAVPQLAVHGRAVRQSLARKVGQAVRAICESEPDNFAFQSATATTAPLVWVLRTPEENDPRGRTQAWQANGRPRHTQRRHEPNPDQLDLLQELEAADDVGSGTEDETEREAGA